jgi:hypothetical protein
MKVEVLPEWNASTLVQDVRPSTCLFLSPWSKSKDKKWIGLLVEGVEVHHNRVWPKRNHKTLLQLVRRAKVIFQPSCMSNNTCKRIDFPEVFFNIPQNYRLFLFRLYTTLLTVHHSKLRYILYLISCGRWSSWRFADCPNVVTVTGVSNGSLRWGTTDQEDCMILFRKCHIMIL